MATATVTEHRNPLDHRRTSGRVNGQALVREFVHHCTITDHPGALYVVVDYDYDTAAPYVEPVDSPQAGRPMRYVLRNVKTGEVITDDLTDPAWTFHAAPDLVVAATTDYTGNRKTWRFDALPGFCDPDMVHRRALKRHFVMYGVIGTLDHYYWTSRHH